MSLLQHALTRREAQFLRAGTAAPFFLRGGTRPYRAGEVFRQPALAGTLRRLTEHGVADFYQEEIASAIEADNGAARRLSCAATTWRRSRCPSSAGR